MPEVTRHEPGTFSWADMGTTDLDGAKSFYTKLFGWTFEDMPMDESGPYTMLYSDGKVVAALYNQREQERAQGIPPNWAAYVTVDSADEAADRARDAGGMVMMEAFDVFDSGRMCVIGDPTGAFLNAWEPKQHIGAQLIKEPVSITWSELLTRDTKAAADFYGKVFGWKTEEQDMGNGIYTLFKIGDAYAGGMMEIREDMGDLPPMWGTYFEVVDCDDVAARTKDLGGEVMMPATSVPTVGRFAFLQDPQKAGFHVITSEPQQA